MAADNLMGHPDFDFPVAENLNNQIVGSGKAGDMKAMLKYYQKK